MRSSVFGRRADSLYVGITTLRKGASPLVGGTISRAVGSSEYTGSKVVISVSSVLFGGACIPNASTLLDEAYRAVNAEGRQLANHGSAAGHARHYCSSLYPCVP